MQEKNVVLYCVLARILVCQPGRGQDSDQARGGLTGVGKRGTGTGTGTWCLERGCGTWKGGVVPGNRARYLARRVKYMWYMVSTV